jgi:hypothetical protein
MNYSNRRTNRSGIYSLSNKTIIDLTKSINSLILKLETLESSIDPPELLQSKSKIEVEDPNQLINHRVHFSVWITYHPITLGLSMGLLTFGILSGIAKMEGKEFNFNATNTSIPIAVACAGAIGTGMLKNYEALQKSGDTMLLSQLNDTLNKVEEKWDAKRESDRKDLESKRESDRKALEAFQKDLESKRESDRKALEAFQKDLESKRESDRKERDVIIQALIKRIEGANS